MLSYIQTPDKAEISAVMNCDMPGCPHSISHKYLSSDKLLAEICVLAITEFERQGWRHNHPVPVTQTRYKGGSDRGEPIETYEETAIREGDCCPSCAAKQKEQSQ